MFKTILKLVYAPNKAFRDIVKNPKFVGPLLIMVLFILASTASEYTKASRIYLQETMPSSLDIYNPDPWTENCTLWESTANITCNDTDRISGSNSIQFSKSNDTIIEMKLENVGPIDCENPNGYKNLTFGMKWKHATAIQPKDISLYLFSEYPSDYFYRELTELVNQTEHEEWFNFTIPLGPEAVQWLNSSTKARWNNITGLRIEVSWPETARSNLTVLIDRLFFRAERFESFLNIWVENITFPALNAMMGFVFYWMLFGLALFFGSRIYGIRAGLKMFIVIEGYALIAFVFMQVIFGVFYLLIPPLHFTLDAVTPTSILQTILTFGLYTSLLIPVWTIIISAVGIRTAFEQSLNKSAIIAAIGISPYYILFFFA